MDILCLYCGEPWDSDHMRHEAIAMTALPREICNAFDGSLTEPFQSALEANGWQFCGSIYSILRCPCCKAHLGPAGGLDAYGARCATAESIIEGTVNDDDELICAIQGAFK